MVQPMIVKSCRQCIVNEYQDRHSKLTNHDTATPTPFRKTYRRMLRCHLLLLLSVYYCRQMRYQILGDYGFRWLWRYLRAFRHDHGLVNAA